jgi:hypothetical protein
MLKSRESASAVQVYIAVLTLENLHDSKIISFFNSEKSVLTAPRSSDKKWGRISIFSRPAFLGSLVFSYEGDSGQEIGISEKCTDVCFFLNLCAQ